MSDVLREERISVPVWCYPRMPNVSWHREGEEVRKHVRVCETCTHFYDRYLDAPYAACFNGMNDCDTPACGFYEDNYEETKGELARRLNRKWWVAYMERKRRLTIRMRTIDGKRIGRQYRISHVQCGHSQLPGWGHG
jgi:hypothetical protein